MKRTFRHFESVETVARTILCCLVGFLGVFVFTGQTFADAVLYEVGDGPSGEWLYRDGIAVGAVGIDQLNLSSLVWYESAGILLSTKVNGPEYAIVGIDRTTGAGIIRATFTASSGIHGLEFDPITGLLYGVDTTRLYTIDPDTGAVSFVANMVGLTGAQGLTFDLNGNAFVYDSDLKGLYSVNITTGQTALVSHPAEYVRGLAWNPDTDQVYLSAKDGATFAPAPPVPVPEPPTVLLVCVGVIAIGVVKGWRFGAVTGAKSESTPEALAAAVRMR